MLSQSPDKSEKTTIDDVIGAALTQMKDEADASTQEYSTMAENVERLYRAKSNEKDTGINPNTWASIGANLLGLLLIMNYERLHPITTKAFSLLRLR